MKKLHNRFNEKSPQRGSNRLIRACLKSGMFAGLLTVLFVNAANADELLMKNGDRLQGSVVSMALGKLVFKTPYAGTITIDWDKVARLTTEAPLEVYLRDDKIVKGKAVATDEGTLVLQPETGPATPPITLAQVKTLDRPKPPETWKLAFRVSAGASRETGNTNTQKYNIDGQVTLSKSPHVIRMYGEYHKEFSKGKLSKDKGHGSLTYERFLTKKWYLFGNVTAGMDKFKSLDLIASAAAGPGYQFWKSRSKNLSIRLGPAYGIEKYTKPMKNFDNQSQREYVAAYWAMDFDMWFFDRFFQLFHHNDGLYDVQDTSNWQVRTRTGVRIPLVFKFFASLQFNYDFDNSPADNKKKYDEAYLFKLGWNL